MRDLILRGKEKGGELHSPHPVILTINNELFVSLYDSLLRKLAFDIQDAAAMRSVRIVKNALCQNREPAILMETVTHGSAMYDAYYPLDDKSYRDALPRYSITRFNQQNLFNNQTESRHKRQFTGGLDRRDGVCCLHGSLTLVVPAEDTREESRLFYFRMYSLHVWGCGSAL